VAYYSLNVDGMQFSGERPWEERWLYIGPALREACGGDLAGKRILELGCNLGLLSVWAAREGAECQGYEYESDILEGGKLLATAFGVADQCGWNQADFNKREVTDAIAYEADICTCLSVMNWVKNKENLINFLSRQKMVLYEGHDSDEVEIGRLNRAGFVSVEKVAISERGRGVFLARK
jgi:2-polyprenyl-3-methyl-5-hydroxy-6-metoxy-1,4-benzoquinol methylase